MAATQEFLSLQGTSYLARNIDGKPVALQEIGNQKSVQMSISTETFDIKETKTGKRGTVKTITKARKIGLEMKLDEQKREDIALAFQAQPIKTTGKTVTDEVLPTLTLGQEAKLAGFNVSALTIKDSASSAKTLVLDTDYTADLQAGTITLLKTDAITQPLKASYTEGDIESNVFFTLPDGADYYYLFKGINTIDNRKIMVELWNFQPAIDTSMDLINDEIGELTIKGNANVNQAKSEDPKLGAFGRIVYLD